MDLRRLSRRQARHLPTCFAEGTPHVAGILLGPPRTVGEVGLDLDPVSGHQSTSRIEDQGAHALGAEIDGKQVVGGAHDAIIHISLTEPQF